ncbi:HNH endonuclease family protein [Endozoicomonas sp. ALC066]|uniref:HNH endonuclease family protein n=1 Tax=Endozoicomonas sp. ALC066 TaxID=3403078 RepID=UPI003BB4FC63
MRKFNLSFFVLTVFAFAVVSVQAEQVKQSQSGICHDSSSPYYFKTKNFKPFLTIEECLADNGRLPKGVSKADITIEVSDLRSQEYDRDYFEHWIDDDGDCLNTRHELLSELSTSTIDHGNNKCTVDRGRWYDPYTNKYFFNARQLDVDHIVPLYWAWHRGANEWSPERRRAFSNDPGNLIPVEASVNREKGAKSPLEWLPPNSEYHCQYVTRWKIVIKKYQLELSESERTAFDLLYDEKCGRS